MSKKIFYFQHFSNKLLIRLFLFVGVLLILLLLLLSRFLEFNWRMGIMIALNLLFFIFLIRYQIRKNPNVIKFDKQKLEYKLGHDSGEIAYDNILDIKTGKYLLEIITSNSIMKIDLSRLKNPEEKDSLIAEVLKHSRIS